MTRTRCVLVASLAAGCLTGCPMDREDVLAHKRCDEHGTCAFGYRCQSGTCVPDDKGTRRSALAEKDAGSREHEVWESDE